MRAPAALAVVAVSLLACALLLLPGPTARAADQLDLRTTTTYDVKTSEGPVRVASDITIVNNDPATQNSGAGTVTFYDLIRFPILRGASNAAATDSAGQPLSVEIDEPGPGVAVGATVDFAEPLFYGDSYTFHFTYELADTRSTGILVTPTYAFLPIIAVGDDADVVVNAPTGDPWQTSLEAADCDQDGNTFHCTGSDGAYLAATVEVSQPAATTTVSFEAQLETQPLAVNLTYLQGEDAAAQHQQEIITSALPLIEDAYGFRYSGPGTLNVSHGGRQSVLGYEGLTSCTPDASCDVVISPIADDYTVIHELTHLWSGIYAERWLSEGFAQLITLEVAPGMPAGLVQGPPPDRAPSTIQLQLDDWGDVASVLGADEEQVAVVEAGYDYSLRFLEELRGRFGMDGLRAVNRNIATSGEPADSRRYMDLLEEASGENLDDLFLLWVFPDSYGPIIQQRRDAKNRLAELSTRLADESLPDDSLTPIQANIRDWKFDDALTQLDLLESNLDTYGDLTGDLAQLAADAQQAGLTLPGDIAETIARFAFDEAESRMSAAREALTAYLTAGDAVDEPRNLWEKFGLLGSDPDGELQKAETAFASGDFTVSRDHSHHAGDLVADASSVAFRRLLIVAALLGVLALAVGVAFAIGQLRQRELAER